MEDNQLFSNKDVKSFVAMTDKYQISECVREIADKLIAEHHPELVEANILYLFRAGEWNSRGKECLGRASKVPEHWKCLYGYELMIVVNKDAWDNMNENHREALVDHELCHFNQEYDSKGNVKYTLASHDLEEFTSIVERHGLWRRDVKVFAKYVQLAIEQDLPTLRPTEG